MVQRGIKKRFRKFCLFLPLSIVISGLAVLMYQSLFWLKLGYWKPLSSKLVLNRILPAVFLNWLNNTESWLGIKKIINPFFNFPLALFLLLAGVVILHLAAKVFDFFSKPEKIEIIETRNWRNS